MMKKAPANRQESVSIKIVKLLSSYSVITLVTGLICLVLFFNSDFGTKEPASKLEELGYRHYIIDKHHVIDLSYDKFKKLDAASLEALKERYGEIYEARKEHYAESSEALSSIINALGVCCLISLLVLYYEEKDSISVLGIDVPYKSVFLILPVLMLYLWLSFGFTYFSALESRQVCYVSAVKYESISDKLDSLDICTSRDFRMIHNLEDRGIIDGSVHYFNGFYSDAVYRYFYEHQDLKDNDCEKKCKWKKSHHAESKPLYIRVNGSRPDPVVVVSLFTIFGTLSGLSIGFIITLLIRFQNLKTTHTLYAKCLVGVVFVVIGLSFLGFYSHLPYMISFIGYICLVAAVVLYIYVIRLQGSETAAH